MRQDRRILPKAYAVAPPTDPPTTPLMWANFGVCLQTASEERPVDQSKEQSDGNDDSNSNCETSIRLLTAITSERSSVEIPIRDNE